jgi:hypothetical protein
MFGEKKTSPTQNKHGIFMNLWCLNYELFLMGNNKILMKSITVSPSFMFCLFSVSFLSHVARVLLSGWQTSTL